VRARTVANIIFFIFASPVSENASFPTHRHGFGG
jgi:hypothetical protein